ncbi:hypothetical protein TNCV_4127111 [Trichonephila clavipes]|uniref:Uncharacterized protein n=1 Tax=Trichonephila clavipes TaxID=2585209 RepID=A0A8X6VMT4_TRICX|nr:hypothetical protein TNCV_4127111 [Trichonephila clavipes]
MSQFNSPSCSSAPDHPKKYDDGGNSSKKTYFKDRKSCDTVNKKFCQYSTSSSLSCGNDVFDKISHSDVIKIQENKKGNEDPDILLFDNEEDKCPASGTSFSKELLSPAFPVKTRKILKRKKELATDSSQKKNRSSNMPLKSAQTSDDVQHTPSLQADHDKHSVQETSKRSNDKSVTTSMDSSPLPSSIPQSTENNDFNEDSTWRAQGAQSNATSTSGNFDLTVQSEYVEHNSMRPVKLYCNSCQVYHQVYQIRQELMLRERSLLRFDDPLES